MRKKRKLETIWGDIRTLGDLIEVSSAQGAIKGRYFGWIVVHSGYGIGSRTEWTAGRTTE